MSSLQHPDMGLWFATPIGKASHTLPTPPSSPRALPNILRRQASRFRLPKILRKTQIVDTTRPAAEGPMFHSDSSSLEGRTCLEHFVPNTLPQNAVPEMNQRSPPVPPDAPISTANGDSLARTTSRRLRKMAKSYGNLRVKSGDNQLILQPPKPVMKTPTLLPSPLPSDNEEGRALDGYFPFRHPREPGHTQITPAETSYECDSIVAAYCQGAFGDGGRASESVSAVSIDSELSPLTPPRQQANIHSSIDTRTPPTSNMSATLRSPKKDRSSSLSSEATWLSKSFASQNPSSCIGQLETITMNEKRLAEKSRRCCHLVQGPHDGLPASWTGERKAVSYPAPC